LPDDERNMLDVLRKLTGSGELPMLADWREAVKTAGLLPGEGLTPRSLWKCAKDHLLSTGVVVLDHGIVSPHD
jgi:hypothetical protein